MNKDTRNVFKGTRVEGLLAISITQVTKANILSSKVALMFIKLLKVIYKKSVSTSRMFWSKEEFRTAIWHTKITCKITQKVVLLVLVLRVR